MTLIITLTNHLYRALFRPEYGENKSIIFPIVYVASWITMIMMLLILLVGTISHQL